MRTIPGIASAPHDHPDTDLATPPADAAGPAGHAVIDEVRREMEELRAQLDLAFDEVVGRLNRVEVRLGTVRQHTEQQVVDGAAVDARSAQIIELLLGVTERLDGLPEGGPVDASAAAEPVDLGPITEHLRQLRHALTDQMIDTRMRIETGLSALRDDLLARNIAPVAVDTKPLEDAADRGALRNAADVANLRRNIDALAEVVRSQGSGITDMATTLDWIKERLLLR